MFLSVFQSFENPLSFLREYFAARDVEDKASSFLLETKTDILLVQKSKQCTTRLISAEDSNVINASQAPTSDDECSFATEEGKLPYDGDVRTPGNSSDQVSLQNAACKAFFSKPD